MTIFRHLFACCALLFAGVANVRAEALVKPLPVPDTAKLAPALAKQLTSARADFDKAKVN